MANINNKSDATKPAGVLNARISSSKTKPIRSIRKEIKLYIMFIMIFIIGLT